MVKAYTTARLHPPTKEKNNVLESANI